MPARDTGEDLRQSLQSILELDSETWFFLCVPTAQITILCFFPPLSHKKVFFLRDCHDLLKSVVCLAGENLFLI